MTKTLPVATGVVGSETPADFFSDAPTLAEAIRKICDPDGREQFSDCPGVTFYPGEVAMICAALEVATAHADLVKALEPFAAYAEAIDGSPASSPLGDICPLIVDPSLWDDTTKRPTLGDARRAREVIAALARSKAKGGE